MEYLPQQSEKLNSPETSPSKEFPVFLPNAVCRSLLRKTDSPKWNFGFNTGNQSKFREFNDLFKKKGITMHRISRLDLAEIDAGKVLVAIHKASQLPHDGVIIEDAALDVANAKIGVNLKWHMKHIDRYVGRKAVLSSILAFKMDGVVFVFKSRVDGLLVPPRGTQQHGNRLYAYFQPDNCNKTLAEDDQFHTINPRVRVTEKLLNKDFLLCSKEMNHWSGPWQQEDVAAPPAVSQQI